jgi:hypothetical protein
MVDMVESRTPQTGFMMSGGEQSHKASRVLAAVVH